MKCQFQGYIIRREIFLTFHAWVEYISLKNMPLKPMGPKKPSLGVHGPPSIHPSLDWLHSPPPTRARLVHTLLHKYTTKSPLVTMGFPTFTPKTAPLTIITPSNIPIPQLTPLTTPNGIEPFCHSTPSGQTDRMTDWLTVNRWARRQTDWLSTDGLGDRSVPRLNYDLYTDYSDAFNNKQHGCNDVNNMPSHHTAKFLPGVELI